MMMDNMFEVQPRGQRNTSGNTEMNKEGLCSWKGGREGSCDKFPNNYNRS